jgi:hypothetical protein
MLNATFTYSCSASCILHTYCISVHSQGDYRIKSGDVCWCQNIMPLVATLHVVTLQDRTMTQAVRCVSPLRRKFGPRPVPVGFLMDEMALGQGLSRYTYAFSCQDYSTSAPYSSILSFIHSCSYYFVCSFIHPPIQPASHTFFVHNQYYVGSLIYRVIK